ncbi:MAG: hypothetical protein DRN21_05575 [Thermoplasmata archaeon]|nr:MAG: hypothetical protein DRN21_05575 [Thermoplasmata archaeon]
MKQIFVFILILLFCVFAGSEAQVMKGQNPDGKFKIIQTDSDGKLFVVSDSGDTIFVEWAKTYSSFPSDTITVSTTLDSVTFSPAVEALSIYTPDEDIYFWVNDSSGAPGLLEQCASMRWTGRLFSITKVYLKKITAGNSKVYLTGIR